MLGYTSIDDDILTDNNEEYEADEIKTDQSNHSISTLLSTSTIILPNHGDGGEKKSTTLQAILNSINYFIGIGVVSLPYAMQCSGWLGMGNILLLALLFSYTANILGKCQFKHNLHSYPDIAEVIYPSTCSTHVLLFILTYSYVHDICICTPTYCCTHIFV